LTTFVRIERSDRWGIAIGVVSTVSLPGPIAVASVMLGVLMIAGAARFLRPAFWLYSCAGNLPEWRSSITPSRRACFIDVDHSSFHFMTWFNQTDMMNG
jgi:hypothetical protein